MTASFVNATVDYQDSSSAIFKALFIATDSTQLKSIRLVVLT